MTLPTAETTGPPVGLSPTAGRRAGDGLFHGMARAAALAIFGLLAGVLAFLVAESLPAVTASSGQATLTASGGFLGFVGPLVFGTLLSSLLAMLVAVPLSIAVALFVTHYAPRRLAGVLGYLVDLLAAVPSVVYGLWGIFFLAPLLAGIYGFLEGHLGFLPFFSGPASATGRTILTASLVLAVMVLPIVSGLSREIFRQVPRLDQEAALALGATRWEMIRMSVLPTARSGVVSASMLGLGRALGETMAVAMVLSATNVVTFDLISSSNPGTIAANIALDFPEATGVNVNVLLASGLVLFVVTLGVNVLARAVVSRSRQRARAAR